MSKTEVDDLIAQLESISVPRNGADQTRLWRAAQSLMARTENEVTFQHRLLSSPLLLVIPKIAGDLGIFEMLMSSKKPLSTDEIATASKADVILLGRILRYLASQSLIASPSAHLWAPSVSTPYLANPAYAAGLRFGNLCILPSCTSFSEWLSSNLYAETASLKTTAFQNAHNTQEPMFSWLSGRPVDHSDFQLWMAETQKRDKSPFDMLPMEQLASTSSAERAIFVDVGGGNGKSCLDFRRRTPSVSGKIINQDLHISPSRIILDDLEHQEHDFLTEQPVKGAKIYHLRKTLRILSDDDCVILLQHLKEVMSTDSVIIVDDVAIDPTKLDWHACYVDLVMGMFFGMRERTLTEFGNIFDRADLHLREAKQYMEGSGEHYMLLELNH